MIRTNADGAVDFKLRVIDGGDPAGRTWRDWIAHRPGRYIAGFAPFADHLVGSSGSTPGPPGGDARADGAEHEIAFDEEAYALSPEPAATSTTPPRALRLPVADHAAADGSTTTWPRARGPCARPRRSPPATTRPAMWRAGSTPTRADGAEVPITVLMRKDTPLDGSAPLLLYGYGAYGMPMEPAFSIRSLSLVDRGWIWATAHVRGGSDKGWGWFLDGRRPRRSPTPSPTSSPAPST